MDIGMLWYDDGPAKLKERVLRAVEYYADKYGRKPNLCLVNPETLNGDAGKFKGVQLRAAPAVMVDHFWLGVEERAKTNGKSASKGKSKSKSGSNGTSTSKAKPKAKAKSNSKSASKAKSKGKSAAGGKRKAKQQTRKKRGTKKKAD